MTDIYLYGTVGDEITADRLKEDLDTTEDNAVTLHVNSYGGDVFEGVAINNLIRGERRRGRSINTQVDGIAASAASYMALSSDRVTMAPGSAMMIHNPSSVCLGDADDMRRTARSLDACKEAIVNIYRFKSNLDADTLRMSMDAETWLTAEDAVYFNLADEVDASLDEAALFRPTDKFINSCKSVPDWIIKGHAAPNNNGKNPASDADAGEDSHGDVFILDGVVINR